MQRAVFLDRDNTLIQNDGDLGDPAKVVLIQGVASAIASLRGLGYRIIVISNQGGVARGKYNEADVEAVNRRIAELIRKQSGATIDRFYFCPYHPEATIEKYRRDHPWRKPQPGMILQAARDLNVDLSKSWTVGDQARDIEAARAAGTRAIRLSGSTVEDAPQGDPDFVVANLVEAVRIIAQHPTASAAVHKADVEAPAAARAPRVPEPAIMHPGKSGPTPIAAVQPAPLPPSAPPRDEPVDTPPPTPEADLLIQILRELKRHRVDRDDFSWARLLAIIGQMIAAGCVLFALVGLGDESFYQWMLAGIFTQLAVIAAMLFQHR